MVEVKIDSIRVNEVTHARAVFLKEGPGDRHMPIWISEGSANELQLATEGTAPARPMPADVTAAAIRALGGTVTEVRIDSLTDEVFYASVVLVRDGAVTELDARP